MAGAKRGGEREGELEKHEIEEILLPFSLPPYPLPLSTPATQTTKKTEYHEGYCEIRISSLCCDVVHELSSMWRLCIFSKFRKGVY